MICLIWPQGPGFLHRLVFNELYMTDHKMYIVLENKMLSALGLSPFSFILIPVKRNHKLISPIWS